VARRCASGGGLTEDRGQSYRGIGGGLQEANRGFWRRGLPPRAAGLPGFREGSSFAQGTGHGKEKLSDGCNYGLEFDRFDVGLVLRAEGCPLPDFVAIVIKVGCKGESYACRRQFRAAVPEGVLYSLGQVLSVERESAGQDLQIVEVLHAAVGDPELHHCFEFLGDDRLPRIGEQARAGKFEQCGVSAFDRWRSDGIAKPDVDLHRDLRTVEMGGERHADTFVVRILGDAARP